MLQKFLSANLQLRVLDWQNFQVGDSIWDSIERAERQTSCGIFLFMADDAMSVGGLKQPAPRDNVIYEAGYFAGAKGLARSLIIQEKGVKLPSDLGGIILLELESRRCIAKIEADFRRGIEAMLAENRTPRLRSFEY
jgi:predicted nucleotide-binding protein